MEKVSAASDEFDLYGSDIEKRVYNIRWPEPRASKAVPELRLGLGKGGCLVFHFLKRIGPDRSEALKRRIAIELKSTFAVPYSRTISLRDLCDPDVLRSVARTATGDKLLVDVSR